MPQAQNDNEKRVPYCSVRYPFFLRKTEHFNVDDCVIKVYNIYVCLIENSERKD